MLKIRDTFIVGRPEVVIKADADERKRVSNGFGASLHYKDTPGVRVGDPSISQGQSLVFDHTHWFISSGESRVVVEPTDEKPKKKKK